MTLMAPSTPTDAVTSPGNGTPTRATSAGRAPAAWRIARFVSLVVVLIAIGHVARFSATDRPNVVPQTYVALMLGGSSIALTWLAAWIARQVRASILRVVLVLVVGYHALFGAALMVQRTANSVSRNDDFVNRLWPHVVHAIDRLE